MSRSLWKIFSKEEIEEGKLSDLISSSINRFLENPSSKNWQIYLNANKIKPSKKYYIYDIDSIIYNKLKELIIGKKLRIKIGTLIELIVLCEYGAKASELFYSKLLFKKKDGWEREIKVKEGRVDGVHKKDKKLVELKFVDGWKGALGQILAYSHSFDIDYNLEIWLLLNKTISSCTKKLIEETCERYGVTPKFIPI